MKLSTLYRQVDKCQFCKDIGNPLQHIHGFGRRRPRATLILINPTHRNLSAAPGYKGARFPFIGVRQFWKVLADGDLISKEVAYGLPTRSQWVKEHTEAIQNELISNRLFVTNVVKCCYSHSKYPEKRVINTQIKFLRKEIKIVKPKQIVAFGSLVFRLLTGKSIVLSKHWSSPKRKTYSEQLSGLNIPVIPSYFPVGRGNPKKAAKILKKI